MKGTGMTLTYDGLRKIVYGYILLPVYLFALGFLKIPFAIAGGLLSVIVYLLMIRKKVKNESTIEISRWMLVLIFFICMVWCFIGGQGGFFYQSPDWNYRNAIFRDLITNSWPVYYSNTGDALVYYIGHWLPAAVIAKIVYFVTGNMDITWLAGRILLWIWTAVGCMLMMLLMALKLKVKTKKQVLFTVFMLIFFSGMDILGTLLNVLRGWWLWWWIPFHLEYWSSGLQYSSNTTCLFWVFNQTIIPWICVLCFLLEDTVENYIIIIVACLMAGPFPTVGLLVFMLGSLWSRLLQSRGRVALKSFAKEVLSPQNLIALFVFIPVLASYFYSNAIIQSIDVYAIIKKLCSVKYLLCFAVVLGAAVVIYLSWEKIKKVMYAGRYILLALLCIFLLVLTWHYKFFYLFEVGAFLILVWRDYKKDWKLYMIALCLAIAPQIVVGNSTDFMMRASIPALIILMMMVAKSVLAHSGEPIQKAIPTVLLIGCVLLGAVTPLMEVYRAVSTTISAESVHDVVCDDKYTLNQETHDGLDNFTAVNPKEQFFFKYLAK